LVTGGRSFGNFWNQLKKQQGTTRTSKNYHGK